MKYASSSLFLSISLWFVLILIYLVFAGPYVFDLTYWLDRDRDNALFQLNSFSYWAGSIENGFGIPKWYPYGGGSPVGLGAIIWKTLLPHRLLGYGLASLTEMNYVTIFKISLLLGLAISSLGWFLFLWSVHGNSIASLFGTIPFVFGGFGTTLFHQEYILGHLIWVPWLLLMSCQIRHNPNIVLLIVGIIGFGITNDYPHLMVYSLVIVVLVALSVSKRLRSSLFSVIYNAHLRKIVFKSIIILVLTASPLIFSIVEKGNYASPLRGAEATSYHSLVEYEHGLRKSGPTPLSYFRQYLSPKLELSDDGFGMFVGRLVLLLGCVAIVFSLRKALQAAILSGLFLWIVLGVDGYFPQMLYLMKVPFVDHFRQWYHFFPYINLSLAFLGSVGFMAIWQWQSRGRLKSALRIALLVGLPIASLVEHIDYFQLYEDRYMARARNHFEPPKHLDYAQYLVMINTDWTYWLSSHQKGEGWRVPDGTALVHFSNRSLFQLLKKCPKVFSEGFSYAMPNTIMSIAHCIDSSDFANWAIRDVEGGIQSDRIKITPDGFVYDTDSRSGIHVLPINPDMKWTVKEKNVEIVSKSDDLPLTIHVADHKTNRVTFRLKPTIYEWTLLLQFLTLIYCIVHAIVSYRKSISVGKTINNNN